MKIYLVGGAVRDMILGKPAYDRDYVVVGSTIEEMLSLGYKQVGKNFPVFLHPESGEEYALARKEISTGPKHTDFDFIFTPNVTLEEDLYRRDLTINAIAQDLDTGALIDPFGGINDIVCKKLRHVSDHFQEDPLRVLRVARFAAQLGFTSDENTFLLMERMVMNGDLDSLTGERIRRELEKALLSPHPRAFFDELLYCGALSRVFPVISQMKGLPQPTEYHPEGSVYNHTMMVIEKAPLDFDLRFAALCHDFGKILTPDEVLPHHYGHEDAGIGLVERFCDRLKVSSYTKKLALTVTENHMRCHNLTQMSPKKILKLIKKLRTEKLVKDFGEVCKADYLGRGGVTNQQYPQAQMLLNLFDAVTSLKITKAQLAGMSSTQIKDYIHKKQLAIIKGCDII